MFTGAGSSRGLATGASGARSRAVRSTPFQDIFDNDRGGADQNGKGKSQLKKFVHPSLS